MDIKNIEVINLRQVKNCWLVQMLPFTSEDKNNKNLVNDYQNYCFKNKIFGIGWSNDYDENGNKMKRLEDIFDDVETSNGKLSDELRKKVFEKIRKYNIFNEVEFKDKNIQDIYQKVYNKITPRVKNKEDETVDNEEEFINEDNGLKRAINSFFRVEEGDIIITRLRNGTYLIGQVKDGKKFYKKEKEEKEILKEGKSNGFSWRCNVDEWVQLQRNEILPDIIGRFSQRNQNTISSTNDKIKLLALKLYQKKKENSKKQNIKIPPIILNKNNFGRSLNPDELEDLVYLYILNKEENEENNKNLILLPSHCKITEPMYEFYLKDKNNVNEKHITCQVKNIHKVEYSDYLEQEDLFKRIYLFSGINDYGNNAKKDDKIIKIITQDKLYECLIANINYFPFLNNKEYYIIDKENNNKGESNEEINIKVSRGNSKYNGWSMHKYREHLNGKKRFKVLFFDDNGKILHTSLKEYSGDNEIEIVKNRIYSIEFFYNINGKEGNFYYNNEFKCFIIRSAENEITNIIDEVRPIIEELIGV